LHGNTGTITGTTGGIRGTSTANILSSSGTISGTAVGSFGIFGGSSINVTTSGGTISGDGFGLQSPAGSITVNNGGALIVASGATGVAVSGANVNVTNNTGNIQGGLTGINATGTATVNNSHNIFGLGTSGFGVVATTVDVTNTSAGIITANGVAGNAIAGNNVTVTNAGSVQATAAATGLAIFGITTLRVDNTGAILAGGAAIEGNGTTVVNNIGASSSITGSSFGILGNNGATVTNAGTILATAPTGIAIEGGGDTNVTNSGSISGTRFGIHVNGNVTANNSGTITGGTDAFFVGAGGGQIVITNSGTVSGGVDGSGTGTTVTNTATGRFLSTGANASAIFGDVSAVVSNAGLIQSTGVNSNGVSSNTLADVTNASTGSISGVGFGIGSLGSITAVNAGSIFGGVAGIDATTTASVNNTGSISGLSFGVLAGAANIVNAGSISGIIAIQATDNTKGTVITNSGSIASATGPGGTAIKLTNANDTLNIKPGSRITGLIDMGNGNDTINVQGASPIARGVSSLSQSVGAMVTALKAQLVNFDTATGDILNVIAGVASGASQPTVTSGGVTASLDPTALAQQDRVLMDVAGGASSMVQGRLNSATAGNANVQMMSYAGDGDAASPARSAFGALGYAGDPREANAQMFNKAPAVGWSASPITVWSSAFGGVRNQRETDNTLGSRSSSFGGAIGVDRNVRPGWLVGLFAGGGAGNLSVDQNSQKVDSDYFFGGAYSRYEWSNQYFDITMQGGSINNRSNRLVQNGITGLPEQARANANGWYVSPEIAYGYHFGLGNGYVLTPMSRLRYVAGFFDGYNETGSAQTLSIGRRTLQDFEERAELELSKTTDFGGRLLKIMLHGGFIGLQRAGDATINAVLIGQGLTFATPGKSSAVGGVLGAGFDYHTTANVALFGAVEGQVMSDQSHTITARGGVRMAF
jgi:uncharacterized protein with beta-barrel porin domain